MMRNFIRKSEILTALFLLLSGLQPLQSFDPTVLAVTSVTGCVTGVLSYSFLNKSDDELAKEDRKKYSSNEYRRLNKEHVITAPQEYLIVASTALFHSVLIYLLGFWYPVVFLFANYDATLKSTFGTTLLSNQLNKQFKDKKKNTEIINISLDNCIATGQIDTSILGRILDFVLGKRTKKAESRSVRRMKSDGIFILLYSIVQNILSLPVNIGEVLYIVGSALGNLLVSIITGIVSVVGAFVRSFIGAFVDIIRGILSGTIASFASFLQLGLISATIVIIIMAIQNVPVGETIATFTSAVGTSFASLGQNLGGGFDNMASFIAGTIATFTSAVGTSFASLGQNLGEGVNNIAGVLTALGQNLGEGVNNMASFIAGVLTALGQNLGGGFDNIAGMTKELSQNLGEGVNNIVTKLSPKSGVADQQSVGIVITS